MVYAVIVIISTSLSLDITGEWFEYILPFVNG